MNTFKKIIRLFLIVLILSCTGCKYFNEFTISFWYKPNNVNYGNGIIDICDGDKTYHLIQNLQDENYLDTGIILSFDDGQIYDDGKSLVEINNYSLINLVYSDETISIYIDGKFIFEGNIFNKLNSKNITISFFDDYAEYYNYQKYERKLSKDEIKNIYENDKELKLSNIIFNEDFLNNAKGRISLPLTRNKIEYSISDESLAKIDDKYIVFEENNDLYDKKVTLISSFEGKQKETEFIIRGKNNDNLIKDTINKVSNIFTSTISESDTFPNKINGYQIKYSVVDGNAEYNSSHFLKTDNAKEKEIIKIKIEFDNQELVKKVVLLDKYYGYLLASFDGYDGWPYHEYGREKLSLYLSKDLIHFDKLNINTNSEEGTNRYRDPFLGRDVDGNIVALTTQGYYNQGIYYLNIDGNNSIAPKLINFAVTNYDLNMSGIYTWAPEFIYDGENYIIYYSDTGKDNSCIYAVKTKDFKNFSYPYVLFDAGFSIIDANISCIDGEYYLFYKDEREYEKSIYYAKADTLNGNWLLEGKISNNEENFEGPFLFKDSIHNRNILFLDAYHSGNVYYCNFNENNNTMSKNDSLSNMDIRHFSIIGITKEEYSKLNGD